MEGLNNEESRQNKFIRYLKGMGIGAFMFFLIKGLVWLAVFFGLFKFVGC